MCELLGMNANVPTDIQFSFSGLVERGGRTGPHRDGWGITFYENKGCRLFRDPKPSIDSEVAKFIQGYSIKSCIVISHVRKANRGRICLENTHPFTRELWGQTWSFAHNGQLRGIKRWPCLYYQPVGTTDSEHAFCWLLSEIRHQFPQRPSRSVALSRFIQSRVQQLHELGVFNMLMSDSRSLFTACGNHLSWITRRAPFGPARLIDADMEINFENETTPNDVVTVIATRPLTDNESWHTMRAGEFQVFRKGEPLPRLQSPSRPSNI
ncbi:MAG: class II glutamine amidotransferase [Gammaproteobacteria bacterium]|nr:class II glutamine amidotransferase [Gammaproteobacteria bacterium]